MNTSLGRKLHIRALRALAALASPVSARTAKRFRRSADKRDPKRIAQARFDLLRASGIELPAPREIVLPVRVLSSPEPLVSIIIPTYGQHEFTIRCVASLARNPPRKPFEVIVVDDAFPGPGVEQLYTAFEGVRIVRHGTNKGFLLTCNAAAAESRGAHLFFLNNDTELLPNSIDALVDVLDSDETVGMTGSRLIYPDGTLQEAGGIIWSDGSAWNFGRGRDPHHPEYTYRREVDYISGAAIMVRASLFAALGGFDPAYAPAYCEDSDLAFRIREQGLSVVYEPRSVVIHFEGKSHGTDVNSGIKAYQVANTARLRQRWKDTLVRDHLDSPRELLRARDRARHRPVILVVDHYVPEPDKDAGSRTIMSFLRALRASGWVVKFWPLNRRYSPDYTPPLQDLGIEVIDSRWLGTFEDWIELNGHALDHVLVSRPNVAVKIIDTLASGTSARLSYYGHDLHFLRLKRQADITRDRKLLKVAEDMERCEKALWRRFDNVIYPSAVETAIVGSTVSTVHARTVVPYYFEQFESRASMVQNRTLLFVAGFAHTPNVDAAEFLVREVMPIVWRQQPEVRLLLVGSHPTDAVRALGDARVTVTGWVSAERLQQYYREVRLAVVPLRFGSGIKSKVVEALSMGLPIVTTAIGAEGLEGVDDIIPVHEKPEDIAMSVLKLLDDDALWMELSSCEVAYAQKHFSRKALSDALLGALCGTDQRNAIAARKGD